MNGPCMAVAAVGSLLGLGAGVLGVVESAPLLAGGGIATTMAMQIWTLTKIAPINIRLAVIEERLNRLEAEHCRIVHGRSTNHHHTPPIE